MTATQLSAPMAARPAVIAEPADDLRRLWRRVLRVPLLGKLLGANLLIALVALASLAIWGHPGTFLLVCVALAISFVASGMLVRLALSPVDSLQRVALAVANGAWYMRVTPSPIADGRIERLGETLNQLLDHAHRDREHMHDLIRRSLSIRESERASLARALRESTAQQLTALQLQLATAEHRFARSDGRMALQAARVISTQLLDDVGTLADTVYPGLLHELGLPAALAALGKRVAARSGLAVSVTAANVVHALPPAVETAIYYAAEEAARNVERHAHAKRLSLRVSVGAGAVFLEVEDDGLGFDAGTVTDAEPGVGLFQVRELLAHVHGELQILPAAAGGTRLIATARLDQGGTS